ncbi:MAG: biotin transporter BioY [Caldisericia bacterium]|nr:biotin transporter BioY [Caldisericia bacterium]
MNNDKQIDTRRLILGGIFVALMAVSAWIKIPFPYVPLTFQLVVAVTAGIILGPKIAPLAIAVYVVLGLVGLPIFTYGGGFAYILQPTFGFIIGFIFSAFLSGFLWKESTLNKIIAIIAGIFVTYIIGIPWFSWASSWFFEIPIGFGKSALIMTPFLLKDIALGGVIFGMFHVYSKFSFSAENSRKGIR